MSFLPEDDQEYLQRKQLKFELRTEKMPDGNVRRGIVFSGVLFEGKLCADRNGALAPCESCDLLVLIPSGYATTKLDSFYTSPWLKRSDGAFPDRAHSQETLFGQVWQFWSRHLADGEWRVGIDGLETYLQYIRGELRRA